MAQTSSVTPVKLFVVTLHRDSQILNGAISLFQAEFGETDFESEDFPFAFTPYYETEMGTNLQRRFYSFARLISPDQIVQAKLLSNQIEERYMQDTRRLVNLDPGYLDYYKVVLASAKFGGQKIYLRDGIYADMTLIMYKRKWESFSWGFPDFKSGQYDAVLAQIRDLYKSQMQHKA